MARPEPLSRPLEDNVMDYRRWHRRAHADGQIDRSEAHEGLTILDRVMATLPDLLQTVAHVNTCLAGSRGMFSPRAVSGWSDAHRFRGNVIAFPGQDEGDDAA